MKIEKFFIVYNTPIGSNVHFILRISYHIFLMSVKHLVSLIAVLLMHVSKTLKIIYEVTVCLV